jgi:hypothetical protein
MERRQELANFEMSLKQMIEEARQLAASPVRELTAGEEEESGHRADSSLDIRQVLVGTVLRVSNLASYSLIYSTKMLAFAVSYAVYNKSHFYAPTLKNIRTASANESGRLFDGKLRIVVENLVAVSLYFNLFLQWIDVTPSILFIVRNIS